MCSYQIEFMGSRKFVAFAYEYVCALFVCLQFRDVDTQWRKIKTRVYKYTTLSRLS